MPGPDRRPATCPVCGLAPDSGTRCAGCNWTLRTPRRLGPVTLQLRQQFDDDLNRARRQLDARTAALICADRDRYRELIRGGRPTDAEWAAARQAAMTAAGGAVTDERLRSMLVDLMAGLRPGHGTVVIGIGPEGIAIVRVRLDQFGSPALPREAGSADWMTLLPLPAGPQERDYLTLADRQGIGDELPAGLVAAPDNPRDLAGGLSDAATLVCQRILGAGQVSHPLTVASLPDNPALACQTMVRLSSMGADADPWIGRLTRQAPELMAPFQTVLAPAGGAVTAQAIADLAGRGRECVMVLLEAATADGALSRLLPAVARWLAASDDIPTEQQRYWGNQLARSTILGGQNRACADLGLLAIGLAPHWLMLAAAQPYWAEYASSFSREWLILEKIPASDPGRLCWNLRKYLDQEDWAASAAQVTAVLDLTGRLAGAGARSSIAEIVAFTLMWAPEAKQSPFAGAWLERAAAVSPAVFQDGALQSLQLLAAGAPPAHIARRCRRAYYDGVPPGTAGRALATSAALAAPAVGRLDSASGADTLSQVWETLRKYDKDSRPGFLQRVLVPGGMFDPGQVRRKLRLRRDLGPDRQDSAPPSGAGGPETESLSAWAAECLRTARAELDRGRRLPGGQPAAFGAGDSR